MAFHSDAGSRPGTVQRGLRGAGCAVDEATTVPGSSDATVDATGWSTAGGGARARRLVDDRGIGYRGLRRRGARVRRRGRGRRRPRLSSRPRALLDNNLLAIILLHRRRLRLRRGLLVGGRRGLLVRRLRAHRGRLVLVVFRPCPREVLPAHRRHRRGDHRLGHQSRGGAVGRSRGDTLRRRDGGVDLRGRGGREVPPVVCVSASAVGPTRGALGGSSPAGGSSAGRFSIEFESERQSAPVKKASGSSHLGRSILADCRGISQPHHGRRRTPAGVRSPKRRRRAQRIHRHARRGHERPVRHSSQGRSRFGER